MESLTDENDPCVCYGTDILKALQDLKVDPVIAYASLGNAFMRMHKGLGWDKKDWIETCIEMGKLGWPEKKKE